MAASLISSINPANSLIAARVGWRRRAGVLPGLTPALGLTLAYLGLLVLLPLAGLVVKAGEATPARLLALASDPRIQAAFRVSLASAAAAAVINMIIGVPIAWTLTRYDFVGRRLIDALIDLPFALPTAVAGIALASLYADTGWIGGLLSPLGLDIAFSPPGIVVALTFVGLPFVVRTIQPVMADLDRSAEEAAMTLGAGAPRILWRVILPPLAPVILAGGALAFARGLGEYGSVIFIAGNRPGVSEIVPLMIISKLEQFDYPGAAALGVAMMALAFLCLLGIGMLQSRARRGSGRGA